VLHMHTNIKHLCLLLITAATSTICQAQYKVLFIGNSYTFGRNSTEDIEESVPDIFMALATAGGHSPIQVEMAAVSGQDFRYHFENSQSNISQEQWTHVILQNRSTQPTHVGDISEHMECGEKLYGSVIANNPDTQVMLYQTWARQASNSLISGTSTSTTFASTDEMLDELVTNYRALAEQINLNNPQKLPVNINPVGEAFKAAGANLPSSDSGYIDLFSDGSHANDLGYYLSACVHYSCIFQSSPEGLFETPSVTALELSITSEQAAFLEHIAWETASPTTEDDTDAPELNYVVLTNSNTLELLFNEALAITPALLPTNYTLVNRGQRTLSNQSSYPVAVEAFDYISPQISSATMP